MTIARHNDPNSTHTTTMKPYGLHLPLQRATCMVQGVSRLPLLFLVLSMSSHSAHGSPIETLQRRDQSMTPKIWVPIVVVILVLSFIILTAWSRSSLTRRTMNALGFVGAGQGAPLPTANGPRELTAEQLAGTINGDAGTAEAGTRRARRPRRTRRTPSQVSVTSLPAYNKEPGEEELVIFRGRDMEDATMPAAVVMNSLDEEREDEMASRYSPMPNSANHMPLLREHPSGDLSLQNIRPDEADITRRSFDTGSHETSSLMRVDSNMPEDSPDPRGETPAYFEVVDDDQHVGHSRIPSTPGTQGAPPASSNPNRRSGFRSLLNRMSIHSHQRGESSTSDAQSSTLDHSAQRGHRPSQSGSGSLLSNSMFRTLSRQRSTHTLNSMRLTSPSLISLNSISPPLTHTVVRTEFTYPKSGPTPEQIQVISSRESFARFGVPYGPDAIAYAASSSRLDILTPPPDFEASAAASVTDLSSPRLAGAGPSRLRSSSNVADLQAQAAAQAETTEANITLESRRSSAATNRRPRTAPSMSQSPSSQPASTARISDAVSPSSSLDDIKPEGQTGTETQAASAASVSSSPLSPQQAPQQKQPATNQQRPTLSEFGKLSAAHPPSSFSNPSVSGTARSESVASMYSNFSYATAAESLSPSTARSSGQAMSSDSEDDNEDGVQLRNGHEPPSTPKLGTQHVLEPTDATIMPARQ